jgi:hypothetical protein
VPAKSDAFPALLVESTADAPFFGAPWLGAAALAAGITGTFKTMFTEFMTEN